MSDAPSIVWFRRDLRIADNPALRVAIDAEAPVIAFFAYDPDATAAPGGASRWWLCHSLASLKADLESLGIDLVFRQGDEKKMVQTFVEEIGAARIFWNRRYFAPEVAIDKELKSTLRDDGVDVETFNGSLLREPWEVKSGSGDPYRVFTPFWKAMRREGPSRNTATKPRKAKGWKSFKGQSLTLDDLILLPTEPNWAHEFPEDWSPGETGATEKLRLFLKDNVDEYSDGRDRPDMEKTSRLSPHLAFGEISPLQIWDAVHSKLEAGKIDAGNAEKFLSEIAWREFSYHLLFYNPKMPEKPIRENFAGFPWRDDDAALKAWQKGRTGIPFIDAGMHQLWRTGWMHNRVRMVVASLLTKNIGIHWRDGAAWFWDTLLDADIANNSASWQWVAGCGADAAPFFRIFNPVTQGEKFDPNGDYVRQFVPEIADLPDKYIHAPWTAPDDVLAEAGVKLGKNYPEPIVDLKRSRERALENYNEIKGN